MMQVSAIGQNQYNKNFGNRPEDQRRAQRAYQQTLAFATMPNKDLYTIAQIDASKDDKYKLKTLAPLFLGIPVVDTFISSLKADSAYGIISHFDKKGELTKITTIMDPGRTSKKLAKLASRTALWSAAIGGMVAYNVALRKIEQVSPTMRKFGENHPVLDTLLNLVGFGFLITGAVKLWNESRMFLAKKMPQTVDEVATKLQNLGEKIDLSKINKNVIEPLGETVARFAERHPRTAVATSIAAGLAVPVIAIASLFKILTDRTEKKAKIEDTYKNLLAGRQVCRNKIEQVVSGQIMEAAAQKANEIASSEFETAKAEINEAREIANAKTSDSAEEFTETGDSKKGSSTAGTSNG